MYINLLYGFSGMRRGLVEFVDASHWVIREQNPEDDWSIQYACFTCGDFNKGKYNEDIPYDRRCIELAVTDIDSRAPGLQEGDERYVEVSIRRHVTKSPAQSLLSSDQNDISSAATYDDSHVVPLNQDSHETQLGATDSANTSDENGTEPLSQDLHGIQEEVSLDQTEENVLTQNTEYEDISAEVEPNSNVNDESPTLGLNSEDSRDSQATMATHQETNHTLLQSSSEEDSGVQSAAQCSLPAESPSLSSTLEQSALYRPSVTGDDQLSLFDTSDRHDQIQNTGINNNTAPTESSQPSEKSQSEHSAETDHVQQNLNVNAGEPSSRTNRTVLSSPRKPQLPEISNAPNPYTEEEMESYERWPPGSISSKNPYTKEEMQYYERWQQGLISGTREQIRKALLTEGLPSPTHGETNERLVQTSLIASTTENPAKKGSTKTSQEILVLLPISSLLLLLVFAILANLP